MALTPEQRKKELGFGGLQRIARKTKRTLGHVSQVNSEKRTDDVVERAIARTIVEKNPSISLADVWPAREPQSRDVAVAGSAESL